jgi:hypothetical protein
LEVNSRENELVQIFELLVALVAAIVAYWQHRQKSQAVEAREEALVKEKLPRPCSSLQNPRRTMWCVLRPCRRFGDQAP